MKKFHFFGLLALICVMPLQAQQYENYDIGKYITPDIKRNKLDLEFGGSGRYNDDKINSNNTNSINGKINTKLNHYLHTRKRFSELGTEINIEGYSDKNHTSSYDSKASNFLPKFRIYSNNRFYNPSNLFLSLGAGAEADFRKDYTSRENFNTNENVKKDDKAHSYPPFSIWYGIDYLYRRAIAGTDYFNSIFVYCYPVYHCTGTCQCRCFGLQAFV